MVYNQLDMYLHIRLQIANDLGLDILILIYILLPRLGDIWKRKKTKSKICKTYIWFEKLTMEVGISINIMSKR